MKIQVWILLDRATILVMTHTQSIFDLLGKINWNSGSMRKPGLRFRTRREEYRVYAMGTNVYISGSKGTDAKRDFLIGDGTPEHGCEMSNNRFLLGDEDIQILKAYEAMCADPVGFFAREGLKSNRCSYCSAELTDSESRTRGYGPQCAKMYGLPYGK